MGNDLVGAGVLAIVFGLLTGGVAVAQWTGHLGRGGDPHALRERIYLLAPLSAAMVVLGGLLALSPVLPAGAEGAAFALSLLCMLIMLASLALFALQPQRLRPAWQRRQIEGLAARRHGTTGTGRYVLELVALREPVRDRRRYPTVEEAAAAARAALDDDEELESVQVCDTETGMTVWILDR
jgi:hypothetical protein